MCTKVHVFGRSTSVVLGRVSIATRGRGILPLVGRVLGNFIQVANQNTIVYASKGAVRCHREANSSPCLSCKCATARGCMSATLAWSLTSQSDRLPCVLLHCHLLGLGARGPGPFIGHLLQGMHAPARIRKRPNSFLFRSTAVTHVSGHECLGLLVVHTVTLTVIVTAMSVVFSNVQGTGFVAICQGIT